MSGRRFTLDRGDARIAVRDGGGALPPIVLTHGLGGSRLAFKRCFMRVTRVGAALSIPEMQAMAQEYLSRWEAFAAALQDLACPAVYVLGSRAASGPDGEAALAAMRTGAERIAELAPGIEVRWLATGHHMTRMVPRDLAEAMGAVRGG